MPASSTTSIPLKTPASTSRPLDASLIVLPLFLLGFLLARYVTPIFALLPGCAFRAAFGFPCPSCGVTRAGLALAQGELRLALAYNPLFVAGVFILAIWSAANFFEWMSGKTICENFFKKISAKTSYKFGLASGEGRQRELRRWGLIMAIFLNWFYLIIFG